MARTDDRVNSSISGRPYLAPLGEDGYFDPLFDKRTGVMNPRVTQYWKDHYDLRNLMEQNWTTLGPKLIDKVHVYVGRRGQFFPEQRDPQAARLDAENRKPPLRGILRLRRYEGTLLHRSCE